MTAPKYRNVDDSSKYNPPAPPATTDKLMTGPVYPGVEPHNLYAPKEERVHGDVPMTGPKYPGVEPHNLYCPMNEKPPTAEQPLTGPVYPGIETANKYNPKAPVVHGEVIHAGPGKMEGVSESNQYCPIPDRKPGDPVMAGPVYRGVQVPILVIFISNKSKMQLRRYEQNLFHTKSTAKSFFNDYGQKYLGLHSGATNPLKHFVFDPDNILA
jgi:hypothetical protein